MRRIPSRVAGVLAVLASALALAPAVSGAAEPQANAALEVQVDLGVPLGDVLGDAGQGQLDNVLGLLGDGSDPTASLLMPVRTLLDQVADTDGLPPDVSELIHRVAALLGTDGEPIDPGVLAPVVTLLRDLADTEGVPGEAAALLDQLADALSSTALPGLPLNELTLPPEAIDAIAAVEDALAGGAPATGDVLAPLTPVLDQVASTLGDTPLGDLVGSLADTLRGTTGPLDDVTGGQLATILNSIGGTRGVPQPTATSLGNIATAVAPRTAARSASRDDKALIVGLRLNRAHTIARVRLSCPRRSPATCATRVSATLRGSGAAKAKRVRLAPGKHKLVRLRIVRPARASIARSGGWLRVKAVTTFDSRHFTAKRALRLPSPHKR
jgi:hypothetical protein